ncbi:hypothetical protein DVH24_022613 [Malus domestica]|uniref:MADS-box domain-containing protein n=1 Tax=Malus domestica TaxID=3750 RepID=A0A498KJV6_MALDO|nr:hypothetical protein DVH24_022613 [Malus domestica]
MTPVCRHRTMRWPVSIGSSARSLDRRTRGIIEEALDQYGRKMVVRPENKEKKEIGHNQIKNSFFAFPALQSQDMVRGKIEMKRIENATSRQVTFSKRRNGLLKKAYEFSVLCDAEVAVIIFSQKDRLYEFSSSDMRETLTRYRKYAKDHEQTNKVEVEQHVQKSTQDIDMESETAKGLAQSNQPASSWSEK